jgi:hypothetical protein
MLRLLVLEAPAPELPPPAGLHRPQASAAPRGYYS